MPLPSSSYTSADVAAAMGLAAAYASADVALALKGSSGASFTSTELGNYNPVVAAPPIWTAANGATRYGTGSQTASIYMYAAGNITVNNGTNGMWLPDGKSASNYRVRWSHSYGDTVSSNMAQNTWYVLTSTYYISLVSPVGWRSGTAVVVLEEISTGAQLSKTLTLTAENMNGGSILL